MKVNENIWKHIILICFMRDTNNVLTDGRLGALSVLAERAAFLTGALGTGGMS